MNGKKIAIISIIVLTVLEILFFLTGGKRTDVYLKDFEVSRDGKAMTLKVGVSSSTGYIRKMKHTSESMNYYLTFYSTFGINSKIGAKDTYILELNDNVDEIYFYIGNKGYKQVLQKIESGKWVRVVETTNSKIKSIIDKTKEINDFSCDSALEKFYEDDNYNYFFNCIKGEYMIVEYKDGSKETIEEALKNQNITIYDLDLYEIDYYKESK